MYDQQVAQINRVTGGSPIQRAQGINVPNPYYSAGPSGSGATAPVSGFTPPSSQPAPVDPYAQRGGQAGFNRLQSGFNTQEQNIYGSSQDAAKNYGLGYGNNILDFLDSITLGQQGIDNRGVQAELAKTQGGADVNSMVGRSIRSGNVMLSNRNASDSSASEAIARAYGDIGNRELAKIGNQYGLEQNAIGQLQQQMGMQIKSGQRKFETEKNQAVNNIVLDARGKLASLDAAMVDASMPDRINLEAAKERVRREALAELQKYDSKLSGGLSKIAPTSADARRLEAARLGGLGTPTSNPFDYLTEVPSQFQNSGAPAPDLPLYAFPRNEER